MKIIKVINNNTVCTLDKKGREQIVSGKGIGFGKKRGDEIDPAHPTDFRPGRPHCRAAAPGSAERVSDYQYVRSYQFCH